MRMKREAFVNGEVSKIMVAQPITVVLIKILETHWKEVLPIWDEQTLSLWRLGSGKPTKTSDSD